MRTSRSPARGSITFGIASGVLMLLSACGGGGGGGGDGGGVVVPPPSTNAELAALSVSPGVLSPSFASAIPTYAVGPAGLDGSLVVTATVADAGATLRVNGAVATSGAPRTIALGVGASPVTIEVTAEDGTTKKTWTVNAAQDDPAKRASWTRGLKKVLIIPVRFTDVAGPVDGLAPNGAPSRWGGVLDGSLLSAARTFFQQQSYGALDLQFTVLPEIDLGVGYATYNANLPGTPYTKFTLWHEPGSFADDVRAKAKQVGLATATPATYDSAAYDLDIVATGFIPGQLIGASARSNGKGVFATTFNALPHELCHNLGLEHSNGRSGDAGYSPTKPGTYFFDAYGDVDCLMGYKYSLGATLPADRDVNPYWKAKLGWLPGAAVVDPATSGTYRVHAFDQGAVEAGKAYALRVVRDPVTVYWLAFRQAVGDATSPWAKNGLEIRIGGEHPLTASGTTLLLDTTPMSRGPASTRYATMHDAPLAIGRTFSDPEFGLHVTPIRKGGTTPESLDVVVNRGAFVGNLAPTVSISPATVTLAASVAQTFTATASDPDGDTLAYAWEFDDVTKPGYTEAGGTNPDATQCTQASHAWTTGGSQVVRCTVSDMKGHVATASALVTITGGTTPPLTISGTVKDENGNPLEGAIVSNWKSSAPNAVTYGDAAFAASSPTAADGKYVVPLPAIGANTYYLTAHHKGFTFTCSVAGGAIAVSSSSVANVNFTRVRTTCTVSGAVVVAGRSYDPAVDGDLWISDGVQSVKATVGGWQMTVGDDTVHTFTATPVNAGYTVIAAFPNPYRVVDNFNLLHFSVIIPGAMPGVGFSSAGTTSHDTVGTVDVPVSLSLPPGYTSWPATQIVNYEVAPSSSAEYGVDYKMEGGTLSFYGGSVPVPQTIHLKILHDGVPKTRTVVIRLTAGNTITSVGPIATFTYTIQN